MITRETASDYFRNRFTFDPDRRGVWREIARYVERDLANHDAILELGPGYCDFINQVNVRNKVAVDISTISRDYAAPDVRWVEGDCTDLSFLPDTSMPNVFASNLLEHLAREPLDALMTALRRIMTPAGRLLLIQPNYRLCPDRYFDDYTHTTIFTDTSLCDFLTANGFRIVRCIPGLLPFSMQSRLPHHPLLVRLYLNLPVRPLARQMYIVAQRDK